jgi:hypothetical protein
MILKMNPIRLSWVLAIALAASAVSSYAQSAAGTISAVANGSSYNYTITLTNTGTFALNSFWYGWTTSGNNLPSDPSNAANSLGWANDLDANSIKFVNSTGTALAPGASATFTFVSTSSPSAITTSPSGESVAYVGAIDFTEGRAGDSTAVFSPMLISPPPPVPTVTATISAVADGASFDYTITLQNTGTNALNSFWYGWTTSGNNLPSDPSSAGNSLGWANDLDANSIKFVNSTGTALAPGASATFTFVSSSSPSAITASPSGESVAYVGAIDFTEGRAGDSTAVFSPVLVSPPPAVPTATATISEVADGGSFAYTITLQNTGTNALNSFWYGWTTSGNNLPSDPSSAGNSLGWANDLDANSIKFVNSTGTALAPGASATFTFVSTSSPSAITASPAGESVAYVGAIDFTEGVAGDSTAVFSPVLVALPPPVPTATATISGFADGVSYDYTITLKNTGTNVLNSFWYAWTTNGNNLVVDPANAANSLGWSNVLSGNSIMWINGTGTALAAGASATFTFVSSSSPSVITTPPSGESVAYVGGIDFSQGAPGDSTEAFSPTFVSPAQPILTATFHPGATNSIILAWPTNDVGFTLQTTTDLSAPTGWVIVYTAPTVVAGKYTVTNVISGAQQFFRLANFLASPQFNQAGNVLIADQWNNRVIETTPAGVIVWSFGLGPNDFSSNSPISVNDSERVGDYTLMANPGDAPGVIPQTPNGSADNRVLLVNAAGQIVWQYGQFGLSGDGPNLLNTPVQSTFVPGFNVLITDQGNNRIIEVNYSKEIVWQYPGSDTNASDQLNAPNSAELLANGHILIADQGNNRALEVTSADQIVATFSAGGTINTLAFASRLTNGDTLLTDSGNARIVEVNTNDQMVWQYFTTNSAPTDGPYDMSVAAPFPTRAIRLADGNTLISDQLNNRVILINSSGTILADYGLPLPLYGDTFSGGSAGILIGDNVGYGPTTTQQGMYSPYDAKIIDDYTGLTPP